MKSSDMIIVIGTMALVVAFTAYPLDLAFASALGLAAGYPISFIIYLFAGALVGGLIFARSIRESRKETIAKITVVWGLFWFVLATIVPTLTRYGDYATAMYTGQYGASLTPNEWANWQSMFVEWFGFVTMTVVVLTCLAGLYIGSIIRMQPKLARDA